MDVRHHSELEGMRRSPAGGDGRLRVLVLGGTRFVGRALVEVCLAAGHDVTLFNRGRTNPHLFPDLETLPGDRGSDLSALAGREWDVVFDVAAYYPEVVQRSVEALAGCTDRYMFISTLSVYADQSQPHDEDWPLLTLTDKTPDGDLYGARKAAGEAIVREGFGERALVVRAGMIVGPHDPTDRLTYWPRRIALSGRTLAPGTPHDPVQFIDVRDLAEWIVRATERGVGGTFNATGEIVPIGALLDACERVTKGDPQLIWVATETLLGLAVDPWMGIPLWIAAPGWESANRVDISRAREAGLTFRPLELIVRDAWEWDRERRARGEGPAEEPTPERERELLMLVNSL